MAGHSQFKNIMHRKGAQDARRARQFAKVIREITVAARTGLPDPGSNPRLRGALVAAREINMPKDTIDRAIKKAAGAAAGDDYVEVRYEGYGPAGVAVIVEALTDNRNRTATNVRARGLQEWRQSRRDRDSVSFMASTHLGRDLATPPAAAGDAERDVRGRAGGRRGGRRASSEEGHEITWTAADEPASRCARAIEQRCSVRARGGQARVARRQTHGHARTMSSDAGTLLMKLIDALDDE